MNLSSAHNNPHYESGRRLAAVFLDRDGVLNTHLPAEYVRTPAQLETLSGVAAAVRRLNDAEIPVIIISNQQGVGKKLMTATDLDEVDRALREKLVAEAGAKITLSCYCPHLASDDCECRKPKPGMIAQALARLGLDASDTAFVGDSATDMAAAADAGVGEKLLVLSGATKSYRAGQFAVEPDRVFVNLPEAVEWLLSRPKTAEDGK